MTSQFPGGEMPGMTAMNDTLAFVKKLWAGMQVPGMVTPSISIDDLDKKIKDLKTVESWLNVNMNMLRGTIQALEVQRATVAALHSMGASFSSAMGQPDAASPFASAEHAGPKATSPAWPMPDAKAAAAQSVAEQNEAADEEPEDAQAGPEDVATKEAAATSQFVNPAAWWTLLQDQFKQAVNNAMVGELAAKEETPAPARRKTAAKPSARKTARAAAKPADPAAKKNAGKADSKAAAENAGAKPKGTASGKRGIPKT